MDRKIRIVAVVGPTASGKTDLGIRLAERFGAEIINADSRQVYRGLSIGSAKPTQEQRSRAPHHVIDVAEPAEQFDCARFRRLATEAIDDIARRGKRVLVVGGTGLYVRTLLHGVFDGPTRDDRLRAEWMEEETTRAGSLHRRLAAIDPASAARLHPNDHVRLLRAVEVYELTGKPISAWQNEHRFQEQPYDSLVVAPEIPRAELYRRINQRCQTMLDHGLEDEVRGLLATGLPLDAPSLQSPGYREMIDYLEGRRDRAGTLEQMAKTTRNLAKRQLTWFRRDPDTRWLSGHFDEIDSVIDQFWRGR